MEEKKLQEQLQETGGEKAAEKGVQPAKGQEKVSETWAEETIADLDDFIESQGIYIRQ